MSIQHQSLAAKQWFGEIPPNLSGFFGSDVASHHDVQLGAVAGVRQLVPALASSGIVVHASLRILSLNGAQLRHQDPLRPSSWRCSD